MDVPSRSEETEASALEAINEVIKQFQAAPYSYLCESDLKCALFAALRRRVDDRIEVPRKPLGRVSNYRLTSVYSEYLVYGTSGKIDLVCLDPSRVLEAPRATKGLENVYIYCLPTLVAIELKYSVMGGINLPVACEVDRRKLAELKAIDDAVRRPAHGLVLGFLQDVADDRSGSIEFLRTLSSVDRVSSSTGSTAQRAKRCMSFPPREGE